MFWAGWFIIPLIVVAQVCCWYAVLTLNHIGHAAEEILWTVMVAILATSFAVCWPVVGVSLKIIFLAGILCCCGSAFVMSIIDVPMYIRRWKDSKKAGIAYLSLKNGIRDSIMHRHMTQRWCDWQKEVIWMTAYFSIAVWISIFMVVLEWFLVKSVG